MKELTIIKKKKMSNTMKVYDIAVEDSHHYILSSGLISHNSYVPMQELAGGTGVKYAASTIALLSKSKERDGTDVIGNIITVTMYKARLSKENKKVKVLVTYDKGLDRYFGLLPLAEKAEIAKKVGKKYVFSNGVEGMEGNILKNPEKYYTPDVMEALEKFCNKEFTYGSLDDVDEETIDEVLSEGDEKTTKRKKKVESE